MASKYSPGAQGSPLLVVTIATAGVLLLLEAIHRLPNIISVLHSGVQSASALAVLFAIIFVLMLESKTSRASKHRDNGMEK